MKHKIRYLNETLCNIKKLSGLYFIIDGDIYVDGSTTTLKHNSHINLFESILKKYPKIHKKYHKYPYLEFPRGVIMKDMGTGEILISGPSILTEAQYLSILEAFNHDINVKYTFEYDEHYTLDYITFTIRRKLLKLYDEKLVELEIAEIVAFFENQINQFIIKQKNVLI